MGLCELRLSKGETAITINSFVPRGHAGPAGFASDVARDSSPCRSYCLTDAAAYHSPP